MEVLEEEENYMEENEQGSEKDARKESATPCLEWYMVYVQSTKDWRKPFKEYLKYGKLLTKATTQEEQIRIRRVSEPYFMDKEKLIRISLSGETKTCIAGQIIKEIIAEVHEQEGHHQTFENTWFTILRGPYWWPTRKRDVASYCGDCLVCLQQNEGRVHEQENDTLILDSVTENESTKEENHATDWRTPYFEYLRNRQVHGKNITNEKQLQWANKCKRFVLNGGTLLRLLPNEDTRICVTGSRGAKLIAATHNEKGKHLTLPMTKQLIFFSPYW
jgi:hypothetical protein